MDTNHNGQKDDGKGPNVGGILTGVGMGITTAAILACSVPCGVIAAGAFLLTALVSGDDGDGSTSGKGGN
jgi:hypothetical protein